MNEEKKGRYWKFAVGFVALVILALGVFVAAKFYEKWQADKKIQEAIETLQKNAADAYTRALADTYGGKTPQETLQMYIDAVESGDYVLASRYFIGDNQEKELNSLQNSPEESINNVVGLLKKSIESSGSYSAQKNRYVIDKPLMIDFKLYPNGIWKIIEI